MSYATATDLLDRFDAEELAQISDRVTPRVVRPEMLRTAVAGDMAGYTPAEQDATAEALVVIGRALTDAHSKVDGYLVGRHALPLADVPAELNRVTCDIARYYLYKDGATETIKERYDDAISWLRDVSAGKASIGPDTAGAQPSAAGGGVEMVSGGTAFSRADKGFI